MKTVVVILSFVLVIALYVGMASSQQVENNRVSGKLVSKGASVPASSTVLVYTAPPAEKGRFILTQVCLGGRIDGLSLEGSVTGPISFRIGHEWGDGCAGFVPGIAIKPGETVSCTNADLTYGGTVTITGVLSEN